MRNLVSAKPKHVLKHLTPEQYRDYCGFFTSPRHGSKPDEAIALGAIWAADNDCFGDYQPERIQRWLIRWQQYAPTCKFFNAPDVIKDAAGTLERFAIWQPIIKAAGWPIAFTVQNGMNDYDIPWRDIDAIFIGSSNDWKYSPYMSGVVQEAKKRGLWVHNGRVNGRLVIGLSESMGCDSFDGSGYTIEPGKVLRHLHYHSGQYSQPKLF